jgi:hypothetical protein
VDEEEFLGVGDWTDIGAQTGCAKPWVQMRMWMFLKFLELTKIEDSKIDDW